MATKAKKPKLQVSLEDFALMIGVHLPTLRVLYPLIDKEVQTLIEEGHDTGINYEENLPNLFQAVETLKEINRLITT